MKRGAFTLLQNPVKAFGNVADFLTKNIKLYSA